MRTPTDTEAASEERSQDTLSERDQAAARYIQQEGGIAQSDLWKHLDVSSRTGSRIARRLADAGVITREETVHDGRRTYWLKPSGVASNATPASESPSPAAAQTGEPAERGTHKEDAADAEGTRDVLTEPTAVRGAVYEYLWEHAPVQEATMIGRIPAARAAIKDAISQLVAEDVIERRPEQLYGRTSYTLRVR